MSENYYNGALGFHSSIDLNKYVFESALSQWTERPQLGRGYDKRLLRFYDALIWNRVINARYQYNILSGMVKTHKKMEENPEPSAFPVFRTSEDIQSELDELMESINTWKYIGKIYRVIGCKPNKVEYHEMIASWTDDLLSFKDFNHLYPKGKYTFLIGATGKDWGFDVNKYRGYIGDRHGYTEHESEIILPMCKKYVKDTFYGTLEKFYEYIGIEG